jgi:ribosome maturation factor RimP
MRGDSHRGAPRSARTPGRSGTARSGGPARPGGQRASSGGGRPTPKPGQNGRPGPRDAATTARLTSVIEPVLAAMEIDLEAIKVSSAGRRAVLRIVVDADGGLSLDDIAEVSREVSAKLDASDAMGEAPYTLEVTSPGLDRPLTQPRHWRRAAGRLVSVGLLPSQDRNMQRDVASGAVEFKGRVVSADQDRVTLDIDGVTRTFSFNELGPGRMQVEFGRLDEIEDAGGADDLDGQDDAEDSWQGEDIAAGSGPDEEEPDGH